MKKFAEVYEEISEVRHRIELISEEMEEIKRKERNFVNADSITGRIALREAHLDELKELDSRFTILAEEEENLKITIAILNNNAQIALYHEALPEIISVLMKYKGKPYGEKTKEKIRVEVLEKIGCNFWLDCSNYHQQIHFHTSNEYGRGFDTIASTHYENGDVKRILLNNKIQEVSFEDFHLCYINRNYVEDIYGHIEMLKALHRQAKEKQEELENICSQYNSLIAGGMKSINAREYIYEKIF